MEINTQICELTLNPSPPAKAKRRAGLGKRGTLKAISYKPLLILREGVGDEFSFFL